MDKVKENKDHHRLRERGGWGGEEQNRTYMFVGSMLANAQAAARPEQE